MTVKYYFDFLSPYSYLSWENLKKQGMFEKYQFEFYPVTLATIIHHYETKGPAEIVPKRKYLFKDCLRFAKLNDIVFTPPKELPFNSLYGLRLALKEISGENQFKIIDALFSAGWQKGLDLGREEVILEILSAAGLPAHELMEKVTSKEARKALKQNNKLALENGVFGLPTFLAGQKGNSEIFWGNDSIPYLKMHLEKNDPVDLGAYKNFVENYTFGEERV